MKSNEIISLNKNKIANYSKKIEELNDLILCEKNKFLENKSIYENNIEILKKEQNSLNNKLQNNLEDLNKCEEEIYNAQKSNLIYLKKDIDKYLNIKNCIKDKLLINKEQLNKIRTKENLEYNNLNMLEEDIEGTKKDIINFNEIINNNENEILNIKNTYSNETKFLFDDFLINEEKTQMNLNINDLNNIIKQNEKNIEYININYPILNEKISVDKNKLNDLNNLKNILNEENENINLSLENIKDFIYNNLFNIELYHYLLINYFTNKKHKNNCGKIDKYLLNQILNDFEKIRKFYLEQLEKTHNEYLKKNQKYEEIKLKFNITKKSSETIKKTKEEHSFLLNNVKILKKLIDYLTKYETEYNYLLTKDNNEYIAYINFDDDLKNKIKTLLIFTVEISNEHNLIDLYSEFFKYYNLLEEKYENLNKYKNEINELNKNIEKNEELLKSFETNKIKYNKIIEESSFKLKELKIKLNILINEENNNKVNLKEKLNELNLNECQSYLRLNENLFKNLIDKGKKIINNELSINKSDFIESVLIDHNYKKLKINELIEKRLKYKNLIKIYLNDLNYIEPIFNQKNFDYEISINQLFQKLTENKILYDCSKEIDLVCKNSLNNFENNLNNYKKNLQTEQNIPFYKSQIIFINNNLEEVNNKINEINKNYSEYKNKQENNIKELEKKKDENKNKLEKILNDKEDINNLLYNPKEIIEKNFNDKNIDSKNIVNILDNLDDDETKEKILNTESSDKIYKSNKKTKYGIDSDINYENKILNNVNKLYEVGIILYKKSNFNSRSFDIKNIKTFPPEKCGYFQRIFSVKNNLLQIKDIKSNIIESKIKVNDLIKIMLNPKLKKKLESLKEKNDNLLYNEKYIQFNLILKEGNLDLISPNYKSYENFLLLIKKYIKR